MRTSALSHFIKISLAFFAVLALTFVTLNVVMVEGARTTSVREEGGGGGGIDGGGVGGGGGGTTTTQCADGVDNDSNGLIDLSDLGCTSAADVTESGYTPPKQCADGLDNDGNGFTDYSNDPGCSNANDNNEQGYNTQCSDNIDNDSNGKKDYPADYGCSSLTDTTEVGFIPPASPSSGLQVYKTASKRDYYNKVKPDQLANGGVNETSAHGYPSQYSSSVVTPTGTRICYLYDPTAQITEWTLGGFDSAGNNSMAAWNPSTGRWFRDSANAFGNRRYNYLTCKTWAPPNVSLSVSDNDIVAGESVTLTWGSSNQRQGTFVATNFSNTIFIPGHNETVTDLTCPIDESGGESGTEMTYWVSASPRSQLALPGDCWWETNTYWVPDQTITTINGSGLVSPTETTTYKYKGTNVNGGWEESVTVTVAQNATLTATPSTVSWGSSSVLAYTCPSGSATASINNGVGSVSPASGGNKTVTPTATTVYTITCAGGGAGSSQASATVTVRPQCGDLIDNDGDGLADAADLQCGGGTTEVTEETECDDDRDNDNDGAVDLADGQCANNPERDDESTPPPPTVTLSATPTTIISGQSASLTWASSATTDTCTSSNFATGGAANRSAPGVSVSPASTITYNITCTDTGPNPDLSGYGSATVTVVTAPTLSLTSSPERVRAGENVTITWDGGSSNSCSIIGPGLVAAGVTGNRTIAITNESTYTLTCTRLTTSYQQSLVIGLLPAYDED